MSIVKREGKDKDMWEFQYKYNTNDEEETKSEIESINEMLKSLFMNNDSMNIIFNGIRFSHSVEKVSLSINDGGIVHVIVHDEYSLYEDKGTIYKELYPGKSVSFDVNGKNMEIKSR